MEKQCEESIPEKLISCPFMGSICLSSACHAKFVICSVDDILILCRHLLQHVMQMPQAMETTVNEGVAKVTGVETVGLLILDDDVLKDHLLEVTLYLIRSIGNTCNNEILERVKSLFDRPVDELIVSKTTDEGDFASQVEVAPIAEDISLNSIAETPENIIIESEK